MKVQKLNEKTYKIITCNRNMAFHPVTLSQIQMARNTVKTLQNTISPYLDLACHLTLVELSGPIGNHATCPYLYINVKVK